MQTRHETSARRAAPRDSVTATISNAGEKDKPGQGVVLIVVAVMLLSLADALVKSLGHALSLWQLLVMAPLVSLPLLSVGWWRQGQALPRKIRVWRWIGVRSALLLAMWIAFYAALPWIPLSVAAVGIYTTPLFIALLARLGGEALRWRQGVALLLGFAGVLVVLRPGGALFTPAMLLPLLAALCYALAMVTTRRHCRAVSPWLLALGLNLAFLLTGIIGTLGVIALSLEADGFLQRGWQPLDLSLIWRIGLYALLMVAVNTWVARAYQVAPSALVGIFDYAYLPFAAGWGFWFFDEVPDAATLAGMAAILSAGGLALTRSGR
ncbi:DMT family transporter [Salinicola tamaricis]|uniref:DMT family transporter n=1 Tax=Salinicola tamaricis TaxID=1771309 RepID=UPI000D0A08A5|nr:DMT family transporter [Salinicola tamaricis]